ncbi:hypothetical protein BOTBODRAFT_137897 [Botryobasidium botryosum FD-172 SS1]|uniref:NADH:flavin oxidoreductase/NADH oxidase N-terminal domain-containing protein n=1 Tax=Botryobasidium botryosum (strain FD-172 SS1) TaxID=930990 RepID=A0A067M3H6_BOTB1|nr:hypothetical protein BOTBODRAFT_137897 [Botryobasidium botryosum FD-172 SS1]
MPATNLPKLFQPLKVGNVTLKHRVVMAPMTRYRANDNHVHSQIALEYYKQRTSTPGTLAITEATVIAPEAGMYRNVPGIYSDAQVASWKKITDVVHDQGSFISLQLWAIGRAADPEVLAEEGHDLVGPSAIPAPNGAVPRPLEKGEIKRYLDLYSEAAHNAIDRAGFDMVEIHGANGYLPDQFFQDISNHRTDEYGGSVENRSRFTLEVLKSVSDAVGEPRTSIRLSPWSTYLGMRMADPLPDFKYLVRQIVDRHPNLAYLHLIEPDDKSGSSSDSNEILRKMWQPRPYLANGQYDAQSGLKAAEELDVAAVYGRWFISNPDLPLKLKHGADLTPYDMGTFYLNGADKPQGYIDYPFAKDLSSN